MWLLVTIGLCMSCTPRLGREEFVGWVQSYEHGLHVKQVFSEYEFDVQYQPNAYRALLRNPNITEAEYAQEQDGDALQYYTLTISLQDKNTDFLNYGISTMEEKQQKLYYYSYNFQDDIHLEEGGKTFPCALYHFERSADVSNSRTFVLAFEKADEVSKTARLVINGESFGTPPVHIEIEKNTLPTVIL
jgi:hypothetical protein